MTKEPRMWKVYNEKLNLFIHRKFNHIERHKINGINEIQPRVTRIDTDSGVCYSETLVHITSIADRGDYFYIGHEPIGKDRGAYGFGYTRLYKNKTPNFGTIAFDEVD